MEHEKLSLDIKEELTNIIYSQLSFTNKTKDNYVAFKQSIDFSCCVNNKPLAVSILGKYNLSDIPAFKVSFSDGFEALVAKLQSTWWPERKEGKLYVDAIVQKLEELVKLDPQKNKEKNISAESKKHLQDKMNSAGPGKIMTMAEIL